MKKPFIYSFNCLIFIALVLLVSSCEKNTSIKDPLTKDEIAVIFKTYSDAQIGELGLDFDALIYENFSFEEIEKLFLQRLEKFSSREAKIFIDKLFDQYRATYNISYLDYTFEDQEDFLRTFLKSNRLSSSPELCTGEWPDLECSDISEGCEERPETETFNILRKGCVYDDVFSNECFRQNGTSDCDYVYFWLGNFFEYSDPTRFQFYWWTDNLLYRIIGNRNISGFSNGEIFNALGCFLGNRHEIAFEIAWAASSCPHEEFVRATKFGSLLIEDGIKCGESTGSQTGLEN